MIFDRNRPATGRCPVAGGVLYDRKKAGKSLENLSEINGDR